MEQAATTNAMNRVDVQEAKKTVRDYAYNLSAAIANAILVTLGDGAVNANRRWVRPLATAL